MSYSLKDRFNRRRFGDQVKSVLGTPPILNPSKSNLILVSQLQHKDVLIFLLAAKTLTPGWHLAKCISLTTAA